MKRLPPLTTYVALSYGFSWILWVPVVLIFADLSAPPWWALLLVFVGVYGPSAAAVGAAAIHGGRSEVHELFVKLFRWRVRWWWYALVLLVPPAFVWIGAGIHAVRGGSVGTSGMTWPLSAALVLATFVPFGPLGEECVGSSCSPLPSRSSVSAGIHVPSVHRGEDLSCEPGSATGRPGLERGTE